jgi:hypothetical protein
VNLFEVIRSAYLRRVGVPLELSDDELLERIEAIKRASAGHVTWEAPLGGYLYDPQERAPGIVTIPPGYSDLIGRPEGSHPYSAYNPDRYADHRWPEYVAPVNPPRAKTMAEVQEWLDGEPRYGRTG